MYIQPLIYLICQIFWDKRRTFSSSFCLWLIFNQPTNWVHTTSLLIHVCFRFLFLIPKISSLIVHVPYMHFCFKRNILISLTLELSVSLSHIEHFYIIFVHFLNRKTHSQLEVEMDQLSNFVRENMLALNSSVLRLEKLVVASTRQQKQQQTLDITHVQSEIWSYMVVVRRELWFICDILNCIRVSFNTDFNPTKLEFSQISSFLHTLSASVRRNKNIAFTQFFRN